MGFQLKHTLKDAGKHKAKVFEKAKAKADKKGATITGNADKGSGTMDTFLGGGKAAGDQPLPDQRRGLGGRELDRPVHQWTMTLDSWSRVPYYTILSFLARESSNAN